MKNRIPIALFCFCAMLLGGLLRPVILPAAAQSTTSGPPVQPGRYSIATSSDGTWFVDSQTGRLWFYQAGLIINEKGVPQKNAWREMPSPVH